MKCSILVFLLSVGVCHGYVKTTAADLEKNPHYSFDDYLEEFGKKYHADEYLRRKVVFETNLRWIRAHNSDSTSSYKAGLNMYADMTQAEFKHSMAGLDKNMFFNNHARAIKTGVSASKVDLPGSVDWRTHDPAVVTPVKNQGGCGSCWAFSAAETIESAVALATGKLFDMAPQQLVSCAENPHDCGGTGGCAGSTQPIAFNYTIQAGGLSNETSYPYQGVTGTCNKNKIHPVATITGQVDLKPNDENALATAVATVGPVAISVDAGGIGWQLYEGGVLDKNCGADIDHAVQIVGYGVSGSQNYWIVRNSWGATWGEKGYIRILRHSDGNAPCAMDKNPQDGFGCKGGPSEVQVCGLCGILSMSSYPTGAKLV